MMDDERMHITIGHLYPDLLNLYGDRGNTITLVKRCKWRGIDARVIDLGAGQDADFEDIDLFFIGGGQDFDQRTLLADLGVGTAGSKAARLQRAIEDDVPVLAICGGYQILGEYYVDHEGCTSTYIGALPMYTEAAICASLATSRSGPMPSRERPWSSDSRTMQVARSCERERSRLVRC